MPVVTYRRVVVVAVGLLLFVTGFAGSIRWARQSPGSNVAAIAAAAQRLPAPTGSQAPAPLTAAVRNNGLGFYLEEVAHARGVDFMHTKALFDAKVSGIMPTLNSLSGASVATADFNNDGLMDFYVTNSGRESKNALYRNRGDGTYVDVAAQAGVADENGPQQGSSVAAAWGDYLNNGCEDLFVVKWGYSKLYRNNCDDTFTDVTEQAGLKFWGYSTQGVWFDANGDGCLDLYVTEYFRSEVDLWHLNTTQFLPDDPQRARNGGKNHLFINRCNGTFVDASQAYGVDDSGLSLAAGIADLNGDGWPDLYVANDFGPDTLYINESGKHFRAVKVAHGIGDDGFKGMNVDFGDYLNNGRMGIYVTNVTHPGYVLEGNMLWRNDGDLTFTNVAWDVGAASCGWSWGGKFVDLNNSGWLDIFTVNGFVSGRSRDDYWFEQTTLSSTPGAVQGDALNFPPVGDKSLAGYQRSCVFLNSGKGRFTDVADKVGVTDRYDGRGIAVVDMDNTGTPDLIVANQGGPLLIYKNHNTAGNNWLQLRLVGAPPSTRDAIGARVTVRAGGLVQTREVNGGYSYAGQSDPRLMFGLGKADRVDSVEIRWPSGRVERLTGVAINQLHAITEAK